MPSNAEENINKAKPIDSKLAEKIIDEENLSKSQNIKQLGMSQLPIKGIVKYSHKLFESSSSGHKEDGVNKSVRKIK